MWWCVAGEEEGVHMETGRWRMWLTGLAREVKSKERHLEPDAILGLPGPHVNSSPAAADPDPDPAYHPRTCLSIYRPCPQMLS